MTDRASKTAEYMALFRLLESLRPADSRLFCDPDAGLFLTGGRRWMAQLSRLPGGRRVVERLIDASSPGARAAGVARTKWIDDKATAALKVMPQFVLLGAGFDMRAYRLAPAGHSLTFELDHPRTSAAKQTAVKSIPSAKPDRVRHTGIDFNCQSITEVLAEAGFDPSRQACWIWEGVTNYLTAEAVDSTLRQLAKVSAKGSLLLLTYIDRAVSDDPARYYGGAKLTARLNSYGEPWTFGMNPEDVRSYLGTCGFDLLEDVSVTEVWRVAGRVDAEIRGYEFYRIASASVRG